MIIDGFLIGKVISGTTFMQLRVGLGELKESVDPIFVPGVPKMDKLPFDWQQCNILAVLLHLHYEVYGDDAVTQMRETETRRLTSGWFNNTMEK